MPSTASKICQWFCFAIRASSLAPICHHFLSSFFSNSCIQTSLSGYISGLPILQSSENNWNQILMQSIATKIFMYAITASVSLSSLRLVSRLFGISLLINLNMHHYGFYIQNEDTKVSMICHFPLLLKIKE